MRTKSNTHKEREHLLRVPIVVWSSCSPEGDFFIVPINSSYKRDLSLACITQYLVLYNVLALKKRFSNKSITSSRRHVCFIERGYVQISLWNPKPPPLFARQRNVNKPLLYPLGNAHTYNGSKRKGLQNTKRAFRWLEEARSRRDTRP